MNLHFIITGRLYFLPEVLFISVFTLKDALASEKIECFYFNYKLKTKLRNVKRGPSPLMPFFFQDFIKRVFSSPK